MAPVIRAQFPDSSVLAAVSYDEATGVLHVEFRTGTTYRYFLVPRTVVDALLAAPSAGGCFNTHIRNRFREERIR